MHIHCIVIVYFNKNKEVCSKDPHNDKFNKASLVFHLRMRQLGVIRDKQAFSAAEVTWEEYMYMYFFCGPSPGMFLFILCLSQMTSEISLVLCSLRDSELAYWALQSMSVRRDLAKLIREGLGVRLVKGH